MRRYWVVALAVLTLLGVLSPPALAQAPAPKVSITGTIDTYTMAAHNFEDNNFHRAGDSLWATNTRARFFITGEVGKAKGVLGLEIDENWGQVGATDSATSNGNTFQRPSTSGGFDLGVDTIGVIEIKQLYVEFPVPLVPWPTIIRIGAQPPAVTYKLGAYLSDDFGGVHIVSTLSPQLKLNLTYAQWEEELVGNRPQAAAATATTPLGGCNAAPAVSATTGLTTVGAANPGTGCARGDDFAMVASLEWTPMRGLDLRPIYAYAHMLGVTGVTARNTVSGIGGSPAFRPGDEEDRHTFGAEARWVSGPWSIQPTLLWQLGTRDQTAAIQGTDPRNSRKADINAWFLDVEGKYRTGPWEFSGRYLYTSGNRPKDQLQKDINYYQPITTSGAYWADWGDSVGPGQVALFGGQVHAMATWIGLERYGRQSFAVGSKYALTPALDLDLVVSPTWTAKSIDTDGTKAATGAGYAPNAGTFTCATFSSNTPASPTAQGAGCNGDESYVGTDVSFKVVWRLADNVEVRTGFSYFFSGSALDISEVRNGILTKNKADDAYYWAAKVGYRF